MNFCQTETVKAGGRAGPGRGDSAKFGEIRHNSEIRRRRCPGCPEIQMIQIRKLEAAVRSSEFGPNHAKSFDPVRSSDRTTDGTRSASMSPADESMIDHDRRPRLRSESDVRSDHPIGDISEISEIWRGIGVNRRRPSESDRRTRDRAH